MKRRSFTALLGAGLAGVATGGLEWAFRALRETVPSVPLEPTGTIHTTFTTTELALALKNIYERQMIDALRVDSAMLEVFDDGPLASAQDGLKYETRPHR